MKIICPFCGESLELRESPQSLTHLYCEYCGTDLTDRLKELQSQSSPQKIHSNQNSENQQNSFPSTPNFPNYQQMPAFPVSQIKRNNNQIHQSSPTIAPKFHSATAPTPLLKKRQVSAELVLAQFNKTIPIYEDEKEYYFGRNVLLPLIDPLQYDVEWLNSISRIQRDNKGNVIRQHFIIFQNKKRFYIEDKFSKWGTWLNRKQIRKRGRFPLHNGDKIELMLSKPGVQTIVPLVIEFQIK